MIYFYGSNGMVRMPIIKLSDEIFGTVKLLTQCFVIVSLEHCVFHLNLPISGMTPCPSNPQ